MPTRTKASTDWTCPRCQRRFVNTNQVHSCNRQSIDAFFDGDGKNQRLFDTLYGFLTTLGPLDVTATKTQISFRARIQFAYLWFPNRARGTGKPELFLTIGLHHRLASPRVREAVNPRSDLWVHHIPFNAPADLDDEVKGWLREAFQTAATRPTRRNRGP